MRLLEPFTPHADGNELHDFRPRALPAVERLEVFQERLVEARRVWQRVGLDLLSGDWVVVEDVDGGLLLLDVQAGGCAVGLQAVLLAGYDAAGEGAAYRLVPEPRAKVAAERGGELLRALKDPDALCGLLHAHNAVARGGRVGALVVEPDLAVFEVHDVVREAVGGGKRDLAVLVVRVHVELALHGERERPGNLVVEAEARARARALQPPRLLAGDELTHRRGAEQIDVEVVELLRAGSAAARGGNEELVLPLARIAVADVRVVQAKLLRDVARPLLGVAEALHGREVSGVERLKAALAVCDALFHREVVGVFLKLLQRCRDARKVWRVVLGLGGFPDHVKEGLLDAWEVLQELKRLGVDRVVHREHLSYGGTEKHLAVHWEARNPGLRVHCKTEAAQVALRVHVVVRHDLDRRPLVALQRGEERLPLVVEERVERCAEREARLLRPLLLELVV